MDAATCSRLDPWRGLPHGTRLSRAISSSGSYSHSLQGGSRDRRYNLSFIIENSVQIGKPFIGVSINYRLDAWGFISSQEVSGSASTNLGLKDQRLALHWVQENIEAFGGDPKSVTMYGASPSKLAKGVH